MSETCERFEVLISSFLDEGLGRDGQIELLDHVGRCAGCRRFYLDARALDGLAATFAPRPDLEPAPAEVWERIESRARPGGRRPNRRLVLWALAAAAALAAGIVLPFARWSPAGTAAPAGAIDVVLEEDRDTMTETRFVELTTELLQADRKYHFAMQDVMEAVIEGSWENEGATSESEVDEPGDDDSERRSRVQT